MIETEKIERNPGVGIGKTGTEGDEAMFLCLEANKVEYCLHNNDNASHAFQK